MDSSSVFEEQRKLEEDRLLEPDSDESVADEAEAPHMEISDDDEAGGSPHVKPEMVTRDKILSVGAGTNSSSEGVHADAGNAVSCEAKMASAEGTLSATSSKPYGVGTPVSASAVKKAVRPALNPLG